MGYGEGIQAIVIFRPKTFISRLHHYFEGLYQKSDICQALISSPIREGAIEVWKEER
jgi:hypothetical protein